LSCPPRAAAVTEIERDGERVAAVIHDASLLDHPELVRAAGAAAARALENERLDAELRARYDELRASRARLVAAGDAARRRAPSWLWLAPLLLFAAVVFAGSEIRYRAPVEPFLALLAALAVTKQSDTAPGAARRALDVPPAPSRAPMAASRTPDHDQHH
jgi:hypothetical protein